MKKTIGKEYSNPVERRRYLEDNADAVEEKGYMKPFTPEQLQGHKENLANTMISISEIEAEFAAVKAEYKDKLKPLAERKARLVGDIKAKAEYVTENCYKFVDRDARMTEYYNQDGDLVEARPATADELSPTIFSVSRNAKTGTND